MRGNQDGDPSLSVAGDGGLGGAPRWVDDGDGAPPATNCSREGPMSDRGDLPTAPHPALARIEASPLGPAQKRALRLVLEGVSYREAATQAGLRSTSDLRRHARSFGVLETHKQAAAKRKAQTEEIETRALIAGLKRLASLASQELERRLETEPSEIQTRDLTVLAGVAVDKIRDFEDWRSGSDSDASNVAVRALEYLFEACKAHGPIQVTVEGPPRYAPSQPSRNAASHMPGNQIGEELP